MSSTNQLRLGYGTRPHVEAVFEALEFHAVMIRKANRNGNSDAVAFWASLLSDLIGELLNEVMVYGEGSSTCCCEGSAEA